MIFLVLRSVVQSVCGVEKRTIALEWWIFAVDGRIVLHAAIHLEKHRNDELDSQECIRACQASQVSYEKSKSGKERKTTQINTILHAHVQFLHRQPFQTYGTSLLTIWSSGLLVEAEVQGIV